MNTILEVIGLFERNYAEHAFGRENFLALARRARLEAAVWHETLEILVADCERMQALIGGTIDEHHHLEGARGLLLEAKDERRI
jgi:hypothetical protein